MDNSLKESKAKKSIFIPNITAFIAGLCIMVLEIVAARLIARYLGVSLYTWTSVIGVVLAGIALGNHIGGRLADRFPPARVLSLLFIFASVSCLTVPVLNQVMGNWQSLWLLSWPARITLHVMFIFFLPSIMLGMIGPVVAKFALDHGLLTGRTIGNIYAWGALGSIVGTFLTGFFLIAKMGTMSVLWMMAGVLALIGILYAMRFWLPYLWAGVLIPLVFIGLGPQGWSQMVGEKLLLREKIDPKIIYQKESQYSYIKVEKLVNSPEVRILKLDTLAHSKVFMDDPTNIDDPRQYPYMKIYGSITRHFGKDRKDLSTLTIGGGGYVFPRYLEKYYPGSHIEVVEIDPAVTETAIQTLGLSEKSSIRIYHLDARNYIDSLLRRKRQGEAVANFDFIYGDAVNDLSVPYQLTTYEFNEKLRGLLAPDGIYMLNLIDSFHSGRLLGAVLNTLQKSFPYVYLFSAGRLRVRADERNTFVAVNSQHPIDFRAWASKIAHWQLQEPQIKLLKERSQNIILTDDYAPVENLLKSVVRQRGLHLACKKLLELGNGLLQQGKPDEAVNHYQKILRINPNFAEAHNNIGAILARKGKFDKAINHYQKALDVDPGFAEVHYALGNALLLKGKPDEAIKHYRKTLQINPNFADARQSLKVALKQSLKK